MGVFFLFKRLVGIVMQPLTLVFVLAALGLLLLAFKRKKNATALFALSALLLFVSSFPPLTRWAARGLESAHRPLLAADAAGREPFAVVVLGNGVAHSGDRAMPALTRLNDTARARLAEGVRLAVLYPEARLVTSGYGLLGMENCADVMAEAAAELGIAKERIDRLSESLDTAHEAELVKKMAGERPVVLVTSATHMPRALGFFSAVGVDAAPAPCDFIAPVSDEALSTANLYRWRPRGINVTDSEVIWHEWMGLAYFRWIRGSDSGE